MYFYLALHRRPPRKNLRLTYLDLGVVGKVLVQVGQGLRVLAQRVVNASQLRVRANPPR